VKSYGGLDPVILPHLRHNPLVSHVRHALALHERRAWFKPTTWGLLDLDRNGAMTRLKPEDMPSYQRQTIEEVWFAGCHSDVGGGDKEEVTARIALRWMLGEAFNIDDGLLLNSEGQKLLATADPPGAPQIHESWNRRWWAAEQIPRNEIDNTGIYPIKKSARGSDGRRQPEGLRRSQTVFLHSSVGDLHSVTGNIEIRPKPIRPR